MIYLDHHAATPILPAARAAMLRALEDGWANPASVHAAGRAARAHVERAREQVAAALRARPADVVLTAGGSEACQLGVEGLATGIRRIVTTPVEHPAVARTVERLGRRGVEVIALPVHPVHGLDLDPLEQGVLTRDTLVAVQWVNHETGWRLPVERLVLAARQHGAKVFVDATQAVGKLEVDCGALGVDALALASHKVGGPAGAGALVLAPGVDLAPVLVGGAQERGRRAGSPSVEAIAGFGAAMGELGDRLGAVSRISVMRDRLASVAASLGGAPVVPGLPVVASCATLSFAGRRGSILVAALDLEGVCVSSGPACSSGLDQPSPTLLALYPDEPARASSSVRFSLGPETTEAEVERSLVALARVLGR